MDVNGLEDSSVAYVSPSELASKLGISPNTVGRAARRAGCGIYTHGGTRLAALHPTDVPRVRAAVHATSGNPMWIATRGKRPNARRGKKKPV
jgi:hypothetical protein